MRKIKGIFFDPENTLRICERAPAYQAQAWARMAELTAWPDAQSLAGLVEERYISYRNWALAERREAGDLELWSRWLLPELGAERLTAVCHELTSQYRQTQGRRRIAPGGLRAVRRLYERGFRLGLIANLTGEEEIPRWLQEDGLSQYFDATALSSLCHIRKPDPRIYRAACGELGLEPEECASVTGGPDADIAGAREAGIGAVILLAGEGVPAEGASAGENRPDCIIHQFQELLELPVFQ